MTKIEIISRYLEKEQFDFPHHECIVRGQPNLKFLPIIGDTITIQAQTWKVVEIEHNIDDDKIFIYIEPFTIPIARVTTTPKKFLDEKERYHFETCGK